MQFKKDIDAAFCLAYAMLEAPKGLLKRRRESFYKEFGEAINEMFHTANRMVLDKKAKDYDPIALEKVRDFCHTIAVGWIYKRQSIFNEIERQVEDQWNEEN
jgi:hypothetical protein